MASQWANAEKVLEDIQGGAVFDDILIEFSQIMHSHLQSLGYDPKKALKSA